MDNARQLISYSKPCLLQITPPQGTKDESSQDWTYPTSSRSRYAEPWQDLIDSDQAAREYCKTLEEQGWAPTAVVARRGNGGQFLLSTRIMGVVTHLNCWVPVGSEYAPIEVTWFHPPSATLNSASRDSRDSERRENLWPSDLVLLYQSLTNLEKRQLEERVMKGEY